MQHTIQTITDRFQILLEVLVTRYTGLYLDDGERTWLPQDVLASCAQRTADDSLAVQQALCRLQHDPLSAAPGTIIGTLRLRAATCLANGWASRSICVSMKSGTSVLALLFAVPPSSRGPI